MQDVSTVQSISNTFSNAVVVILSCFYSREAKIVMKVHGLVFVMAASNTGLKMLLAAV